MLVIFAYFHKQFDITTILKIYYYITVPLKNLYPACKI